MRCDEVNRQKASSKFKYIPWALTSPTNYQHGHRVRSVSGFRSWILMSYRYLVKRRHDDMHQLHSYSNHSANTMASNDESDKSATMADGDDACRNIFEEERKALLNGYVKVYTRTLTVFTITFYESSGTTNHLPYHFVSGWLQSCRASSSECPKSIKV